MGQSDLAPETYTCELSAAARTEAMRIKNHSEGLVMTLWIMTGAKEMTAPDAAKRDLILARQRFSQDYMTGHLN